MIRRDRIGKLNGRAHGKGLRTFERYVYLGAKDLANCSQLGDVLVYALEFGRGQGQGVLNRSPALLKGARGKFRRGGVVTPLTQKVISNSRG
jgi:hypothetical protein